MTKSSLAGCLRTSDWRVDRSTEERVSSTFAAACAATLVPALRAPWLVLVDLDHEHPCAAALVGEWLPQVPTLMRLRVAVREIEAWLLADRVGIAACLSVSRDRIPRSVDELDNPKSLMINVASRSRRRAIRDGMPPRAASGRSIGPLYVTELSRFVREHWDVDEAALASSSLCRCIRALRTVG